MPSQTYKSSYIIILFLILLFTGCDKSYAGGDGKKPKLIVGIVVDQMRADYLERFYPYFGDNGFRRLMNQGAYFTNASINYIPSVTAPGHASIYTGTFPFFHGIINNDWYDRYQGKSVNAVKDTFRTVGSHSVTGRVSPNKLVAGTLTDEIKLATRFRSKVFSISIKDRAAVLPAGHYADGAFWYDESCGKFVSSTYYMRELPEWLKEFNNKKSAQEYMSRPWALSRSAGSYSIADSDDAFYEPDLFKEGRRSFPHRFDKLDSAAKFEMLPYTPGGNQLLFDLFRGLLRNEIKPLATDMNMIAVSFSSPDYAGHAYGPSSVEIMDMYIKLDSVIANMLTLLDTEIGKGDYLLFLSSDHGVTEFPEYTAGHGGPGGRLKPENYKTRINSFCAGAFRTEKVISFIGARQIYLNRKLTDSLGLRFSDVCGRIKQFLTDSLSETAYTLTRPELESQVPGRNSENFLLNGFNPKRSGDILFELRQGYVLSQGGNTTHSTSYGYDTHIPMLFYGWGVLPQKNNTRVFIVDVAPTAASLIGINPPAAAVGIPLLPHKK